MKRAIIAMMLLAASLQLGAQGKDIEYLKTLIEGRRVSFDYLLTPEVKQISKLEGKVLIDGECYHIWGNQLEIICDGVTKWSVDQAAKEVYIEKSDGTREFLVNPSSWEKKVKDMKVSGNTATGSWTDDMEGHYFTFKFSSISSAPLSGTTKGFDVDVQSLGSDWVVTDLR